MSAATSTTHSQERTDAFRRLIRDVSEKLLEIQVSQIDYLRDVPPTATGRKKTGLDVLIALEKVGTFSPWKTEPLIKLLEDVKRFDVANYVREQYQTKYPDATSKKRGGVVDTYNSNSNTQLSSPFRQFSQTNITSCIQVPFLLAVSRSTSHAKEEA